MSDCLLSIVIANYNYGRFLEAALGSIISQCGKPYRKDGCVVLPIEGTSSLCVEIIICDAASSDNSIDVIQKHEKYISWWCSEKDHGQSEAFNKGFSHARGRFLTWLNADEIYTPGTFLALCDHLRRHPTAKWITSNDFAFLDGTCRIPYICWGPHFQPWFLRGPHAATVSFGPSSFIAREAYERTGTIDEDIHYGMDTTYWKRMSLAGYSQSRMNRFSWGFRVHAESKTSGTQSEKVASRRRFEQDLIGQRYGRAYSYSWRNPWYILWMVCRFFDGSLLKNLMFRLYMCGKDFRMIFNGSLWYEHTPKYVYADVGRTGLGNMLFSWARAVVFAREHGCKILAPDWVKINRIGPWIRGERDKRYYFGAFTNSGYVSGLKKFWLLAFKRTQVKTVRGLGNYFADIAGERDYIKQELVKIVNSHILADVANMPKKFIGVHVRRGDFASTGQSLQADYYLRGIEKARTVIGATVPVCVFSDAAPWELEFLKSVKNLVIMPKAPAIQDILSLSKAEIIVGTNHSSFSEWAVFLGGASAIWSKDARTPGVESIKDEFV